jgi:hypothetical protein
MASMDELPLGVEPAEPTKRCPACGALKPPEDFPRNRSTRDGRGVYCKPCHNRMGRESKIKNHGGSRHYHLKRRYGITAAEADAMLDAQGGMCAICGDRPAAHVDHDHRTGAVRSLLCFTCNSGLGNFRDEPELLRLAADYLDRHESAAVKARAASLRPI